MNARPPRSPRAARALVFFLFLFLAPALVLLANVAAAAPAATREAPGMGPPAYVDLRGYPSEAVGWNRFVALENALRRAFDDVCPDTFCEGEYSNLQSLRYRCSVRVADGSLGECRWTLAGSTADVDPRTGAVVVDARTWACLSPLAEGTGVEAFYRALEVRRPMMAPLPGSGLTLHEGLMDCLH